MNVQMEAIIVFSPSDWNDSSMDGTSYAVHDLKACLEGLARHLFAVGELSSAKNPVQRHQPEHLIPICARNSQMSRDMSYCTL
ncbi:hypothetical protein QVD17_15229 [Tagetes erecta]|uniref:Uncharacterized protein n=1 Tax=Tagetes erecta TaxID=13708 RepID=A0AAD8KNW9_TARER|nr:hypothetical protein QVD17_15229 [Tagetes erecta]